MASSPALALDRPNAAETPELHPVVRHVVEYHLSHTNRATARELVTFLGQNPGEFFSYQEIIEGTSIKSKTKICQAMKSLIDTDAKTREIWGLEVTKKCSPDLTASNQPRVRFGIKLLRDYPKTDVPIKIPTGRIHRECIEISDRTRKKAMLAIKGCIDDHETSLLSVLSEDKLAYARNLVENGTWVFRHETGERDLMLHLLDSIRLNGPVAIQTTALRAELKIKDEFLLPNLEHSCLNNAFKLGVFLCQAQTGYWTAFVLEPELREGVLMREYPDEKNGHADAGHIFFDKVMPFKYSVLQSRTYPRSKAEELRVQRLSARQIKLLRVSAYRMDKTIKGSRKKPASIRELRSIVNVSDKTVRRDLQAIRDLRYQTGMYLRVRNDRFVEPVLLSQEMLDDVII